MGSTTLSVCVLAGGQGTRIRPLFPRRPKGLIPIRGKPFLEHQLTLLASQGFRSFVFCLGHLADQIARYFGDGTRWGVRIEYSVEAAPLGTAGALRHAAPFFQNSLLVLNGDTYATLDYQALVAAHRRKVRSEGAIGTLALMKAQDPARYGQVAIGENHKVTAFREKGLSRDPGLVSAGVYVLEPRILEYIPHDRASSLENETFPVLIERDEYLYGFPVPNGSFVDVGTPEGYHTLERLL